MPACQFSSQIPPSLLLAVFLSPTLTSSLLTSSQQSFPLRSSVLPIRGSSIWGVVSPGPLRLVEEQQLKAGWWRGGQ